MQLRAVQQFVVHIESFRNIDIWYQGAYLLLLQIYTECPGATEPQNKKIYAHPFAFTQHYMSSEPQAPGYDTQVIKGACIDNPSSSFLSKSFLLRYYQEEVELNDICHFRVQSEISPDEPEYILQIDLLFYDQQIKKIDPSEIIIQKGKKVKTKRYVLRNSKSGIHDYVQAVFDGQYYSLANISIHTVCLDYRFRMSKLQLFQFSQMTPADRKKMLDKNKKMQSKQISYIRTIAGQLNVPVNSMVLQTIEDIVIKGMKKHYHTLLKEYGVLFGKVITEFQRKSFSQIIVHPSQLGLFEDQIFSKGNSWQEQLYKKYKSTNEDEIIEKMINQANLISAEMIKLWHHFIDLIKISPRFSIAYYEAAFFERSTTFWNKYRKLQPEKTTDICVSSVQNDHLNEVLQKELASQRQKVTLEFHVFNQQWIQKKNSFATMVENYYDKRSSKQFLEIEDEIMPKTDVTLHLVVLVHGFQGNSMDMKLIKNTMSAMYPQASFLCATSNEDMTDTDIIEMGHRLATEIKNHIIQFFPPDTLDRISFVGHSLGGVIIRAALPRLMELKQKFHTFISFSSPHIGYKVNASSVIEAGIWVLQKFKNSNCLKQLTMHDSPNPRQTCLYRISRFQGLAHFKNIFLFSSKQDSYAPYESARIQIHPDFMNAKDPLKQVHCEMVRNILNGVSESALRRIRVNFTIEQTNIDSIIGRTAHILFLQNSQLIQMFLSTHPGLLQ